MAVTAMATEEEMKESRRILAGRMASEIQLPDSLRQGRASEAGARAQSTGLDRILSSCWRPDQCRNRRNLAVRPRFGEGQESTLFGTSARLCRTHRVAGGTLPAVDLAMPHNPVLGYASAPLRYRIIQITLIV